MTVETADEMIEIICKMSDRQISTGAIPLLKSAVGKEGDDRRDILKKFLDTCMYGTLASSFVISAVEIQWREFGGTVKGVDPWRMEHN